MRDIINIFRYKLLGLNLLLIILLAIFSFSTVYIVPFLYLFTVNLFDILGYHFTLIRRTDQLPDKETVKSYRIIQFMFDVALVIMLGIIFGWIPVLCGFLLKLFAVQDLLYYLFLRTKLPGSWNWLRFTPLGWFKKRLNNTEVLWQAVAGLLLAMTIMYLYQRSIISL